MATLKEVMIGKSEEGLMDYLNNFNKYTPEAITAAFNELKNRGRIFSEEEQNEINIKIQTRIKEEEEEERPFAPAKGWKQYIVADSDAPLFYSKAAISIFSVLFSAIFGAVLLSFNITDSKRKMIVLGFGVIYTIITIIILNVVPSPTYFVAMLNAAGGLALTSTFWDKYLGKETKYRAKPIWTPLIIAIIITILIFLAIIYGDFT